MDFMGYSLYCSKRFRALNIIDESARERPAIACLRCRSEHIKNRQLHNLNYSLKLFAMQNLLTNPQYNGKVPDIGNSDRLSGSMESSPQ